MQRVLSASKFMRLDVIGNEKIIHYRAVVACLSIRSHSLRRLKNAFFNFVFWTEQQYCVKLAEASDHVVRGKYGSSCEKEFSPFFEFFVIQKLVRATDCQLRRFWTSAAQQEVLIGPMNVRIMRCYCLPRGHRPASWDRRHHHNTARHELIGILMEPFILTADYAVCCDDLISFRVLLVTSQKWRKRNK